MKNSKYYAMREEQNILMRKKSDEDRVKELKRLYRVALNEIDKEINKFFAGYAAKEGISIGEAKKRADKMDIQAFKDKAKKYVKEKDFSDRANKELRLYNLTMKANRLELIKAHIGLELVALGDEVDKHLENSFQDEAMQEAKRQAGILGDSVMLDSDELKWASNQGFAEGTFSTAIWGGMKKLTKDLNEMLTKALITGKHSTDFASELAKRMNSSLAEAKRILVTEMGNIQIETQRKNYVEQGIEYFQNVIEPDACKRCQAKGVTASRLDNSTKRYKVSEMVKGKNAPMFHPHCRCSIVPYVEN